MSSKFDIERFGGKTSFALWQVCMAAILSTLGIKDAIYGREEADANMTDKKWKEIDDKVLSTIHLCLSDATLQEVLSETTAMGLWKKLQETYMKKFLTNQLRLKLRLYTLHMAEGTSISDHVAEFTSILNDLGKLDVKVEDEDQTLLLLCYLSTSYKSLRDMMIYGREKISLEDVNGNLQAKLHLDNDMTSVDKGSQGVGLVAERGRSKDKTPTGNKSRSKPKHKNLTCNYCKKKGHIQTNCLILKNKQKGPKGVASEEANVAKDDDTYDVLCMVDNCVNDKNAWIMDLGASQHMTPNRDWFETYEPSSEKVFMGNNHLCKVAGMGSVKIKFHDGKIRMLRGVRHIPDLSKNLISLGSLEEKGCKFQSDGGVLCVSKGALTIMRGKRVESLYFLQGSTVIGSASVASSDSTSDVDVTKL